MKFQKIKEITLLLFVIILVSCANNEEFDAPEDFDPERDAVEDIRLAVYEAQKTGKRILLDVGGEWCIWCHRLDHFIDTHENLNKYLHDNFVVLKVNYSDENKNEEVLSKYPKIPGYPHFFVLENDGTFLHSRGTGVLEDDESYSEEKIMNFLKEWAPGS